MQISLAAQKISLYLGSDTYIISVEFLHSFPAWKTVMAAQNVAFFLRLLTTHTPINFHILIHYLQVDKLKISNTSTFKPNEEKQANTEEEDNGTN